MVYVGGWDQKQMICDICSNDNPRYWAWSYKLEDWVPMCEDCFDREQPDKWEKMEKVDSCRNE